MGSQGQKLSKLGPERGTAEGEKARTSAICGTLSSLTRVYLDSWKESETEIEEENILEDVMTEKFHS